MARSIGASAHGAPAALHAPVRTVPEDVAVAAQPIRAASLIGTEVDGRLTETADGELVIDEELRRFLDYFLTATGELPAAVIRADIEAEFAARLGPRAAGQARALLDRYLRYRDSAGELRTDGDLAERLADVRALRRRHLGAKTAAALFGAEESDAEAALARRQVLAEAGGDAERLRALTTFEAQLPAPARSAFIAVTTPIATLEREEVLKQLGAPETAIWALRTERFGAEATERLARLDQSRETWHHRLDAFRARRAELEQTLDGPEAQRQLNALLASSFAAEEQPRVAALERLAGRPLP